ncbi:CAP domain-containing protein [Blastococcus sp. SYSU DS0753]
MGLAVAMAFGATAVVLTAPVVSGPEEAPRPFDPSSSAGSAPHSSTSVVPGTAPAAPGPSGDTAAAPETGSGQPAAAVPEPAPEPAPAPGHGAAPPSAPAGPSASTSRAPAPTAAAAAPPPGAASAPATGAASAPAAPGAEGEVVALVNAQRSQAGCGPVAADAGLAAVARAHSAGMRDRGFFDHVDPDGLDPFDRADRAGVSARAENIARGQADPAAVMASWLNSPGHRANILNCGLTRLGVGVATGSGGPWWTQLFG